MEALSEKDEEINISELQQTQSWSPSVALYKYEGIWYPERIIKGIVSFQKNFVPQPNDIFLCTTPKCGTTWLKALSFTILTRTRYLNVDSNKSGFGSESPLLSKSPHDLVPFIERYYAKGIARDTENPLVHTHVPFSSLPKSILNSNSKLIYICRDPKDVLISNFLFESSRVDVLSFDEVYEMFCNGVLYNGPYWDHVLGYWKASLELPHRVLFLKYEDLKNDICFYVKKIADFMCCSFSEDEMEKGMVEKIARLCSFENLSKLDVNKSTQNNGITIFSNVSFFRKGEIGDWKNYLTPQMADRIDKITYEKFHAYGLNL